MKLKETPKDKKTSHINKKCNVKIFILSKAIYQLNEMPINIPMTLGIQKQTRANMDSQVELQEIMVSYSSKRVNIQTV